MKRGGVIFALLLLFLFSGGLYLCKGWPVEARLFPLIIVVGGIGFAAWLVRAEMTHARKKVVTEKDKLKASLKGKKEKKTTKGEVVMLLWVAAFVGIVLVFGFWIAIAVFTFAFMFLFGRENWKILAIYPPALWAGIYLIFHVGLRVPLYGGTLGLSLPF